ncbi:hypothetical protein LEN26_007338 [Aphanomyces euteiches]|nr:hypothetical protein AeMF1_018370 [Aphanomyces euteiches]KAH9132657.1 hypothetical protein LEN26_007338 [Aphanomyces euteiches]KAH9192158.1 hypothetical protein AeNC1_005865 [Aphanomyces euteiches]
MGKKKSRNSASSLSSSVTTTVASTIASPTYGSGQPLLGLRRNAYFEADRKCRDVVCLIFFGIFWLGMVTICIVAFQYGNVSTLVYPRDHNGQLCNASFPDAFYPHPALDVQQGSPTYYGICVEECPKEGDVVDGQTVKQDTVAVFHRCVPTNLTDVSDATADAYEGIVGKATSSSFKYLARYIDDVRKTWRPILGFGCGVGAAGSIVWLALLRFFPKTVVWGSLFVSLATLFLATGVAAVQSKMISSSSLEDLANSLPLQALTGQETIFQVLAVILLVVDVALVLIVIFLTSRISLAVGIIHEACRAISNLPGLYFFPLAQMTLLVGLFGYFVVSSLYIASSGTITAAELEAVYNPHSAASTASSNGTTSNLVKFCFGYNLVGVLWTQQLLEAITVCTIAGAVSRFYWCDSRDQLGFAVVSSHYNCFRFHLGSLAFGAAIIAIVQFFRLLLEYIDQQTKQAQNRAIQVVVCCCRACLWCLHKVVKFLSRNGYILVAMKGSSFCTAVVEAFQLVAANLLRIGTLSVVATFVMVMGKLTIMVGCALLVFWYISKDAATVELSSPFPSLALTAILAYAVASLFFGVFEIAMDTVLLSVCEDESINRTTGSYYASADIRAFLDASAAHAFKHHKQIEDAKRSDVTV